jgi:hypothetical protein
MEMQADMLLYEMVFWESATCGGKGRQRELLSFVSPIA